MNHAVVAAFLALSLSSTPFVPKASPGKPQPPPVVNPKPPPPQPQPPPQDRPEHDRPEHDRPHHHDHSDRGPDYRQDSPEYREDPSLKIIRRNMPQVESCFAQARSRAPSRQGTVVLEWDVDLDARVQHAQVVENTTGDNDLADCILLAVKGWQFRDQDITYPGHLRHAFQLQQSP
jgi:hypothetical protein